MDLESSDEEYFDTFSDLLGNEMGIEISSNYEQETTGLEGSFNAETFNDASKINLNNSSKSDNLIADYINEKTEETSLKSENFCESSNVIENDAGVPISNYDKLDLTDSSDCESLVEDLSKLDFKKEEEKNETEQGNTPKIEKSNEEIQLEERMNIEATMSIEEIVNLKEKSLLLKEQGNSSFKLELYEKAIELYTNAIYTCPLQFSDEHAIFYSNRGTTLAKLNKNEEAIKDLSSALELKPDYLKALLRRAELREKTDKLTEALEDYREVLKIDPRNWSALHAEQTLPEKIKIQQEKMKEEMFTQLKQLGNLVLKPFGLSTENFKMVQDPATGSYSINFQNK